MADPQGHGKHPAHGNTPAAWTTVTIILIGSVIAGVAVVMGEWWLFYAAGIGLSVVGLLVGKVMGRFGLGSTPPRRHSQAEVAASAAASQGSVKAS